MHSGSLTDDFHPKPSIVSKNELRRTLTQYFFAVYQPNLLMVSLYVIFPAIPDSLFEAGDHQKISKFQQIGAET